MSKDRCPSSINQPIDPSIVARMVSMAPYAVNLKQIATECEVNISTVARYLRLAGIEKFKMKIVDSDKVDHLLITETRFRFNRIALECDCSPTYVSRRAKKIGVLKRSNS
jgi:hypothetical protein